MTKHYRLSIQQATSIAAMSATALCVTAAAALAAPAPPIYVNGARVAVPAIERDARVFVPIRGVFERLGAAVIYHTGKNIVVRKNNADIARVAIGTRSAMMLGRPATLDTSPFRSLGRVFVPLRFISESAGATVAYTTSPHTIKITDLRPVRPAAAVVEPAAVAAAPVAAPAEQHGIPWWVWLLLAAVLLLLLLLFLRRRKPEPVIVTRSAPRSSDLK